MEVMENETVKDGIIVPDRNIVLPAQTVSHMTPPVLVEGFEVPMIPVPDYLVTKHIHPGVHWPLAWSIIESTYLGGRLARDTLYAWLKVAYMGAYYYEPCFGQVVFIFGPAQNGKTLVCNRIIVPLLGGKQANPYDYLVGKTTFNEEIFSAGVLAINDEESPADLRAKNTMLQKLKGFAANGRHAYSPKHLPRATTEWRGRLVITGNEDPNSLRMLVEINDNTVDKVLMFATQKYCTHFPSMGIVERQIAKELPYLARWLLELEYPSYVMDPANRCQVRSYQHPKMLAWSSQQERSFTLIELIRRWIDEGAYWKNPDIVTGKMNPTWTGSPTDLMGVMITDTDKSMEILLKDWNADKVSASLGSISRQPNLGIEALPGKKQRKFLINREVIEREED